MRHLPAFLDLAGRRALVLGDGPAARRKAELLRSAGAEAMQINHEVRVVAQTSFESGKGGVLVDGRLLKAPFTIDVIGPPDNLVDALRFPDGPQDQFAEDEGGELTFEDVPSVDVETVRDRVEADAAQAQQ